MAIHVFVAMPFGVKEGIDFNAVYNDLIKPALEQGGFEVFRADEEMAAGDIRTDMFQELLLADLVVADLTIDNPNVWYEVGVRHALRARGVVLIQSRREKQPFDIYTDRKLRYHLQDGRPDPEHLEEDKTALARMARETMTSWHGRKISPVYHLLRYLQEPDWKSLKVEEAKAFWERQEAWERRIEVAREKDRPGDILVLADEAPVYALRLEAYRRAGKALRGLGQFSCALDQVERALEIAPDDLDCAREKGLLLGRLGKHEEARAWLESLIHDHPDDPETSALLGRVEKDAWVAAWRAEGRSPQEMRQEASYETELLREAIRAYAAGFQKNPAHYYSGINAVTLLLLSRHLTGEDWQTEAYRAMEGGVRWAIQTNLAKETPQKKDFWARVTLGDLEVLTGDVSNVVQAYKHAVAAADKNWFNLDSSRQQLLLLHDLGFRPEPVSAALGVFDRALAKLKAPEGRWEPRHVFLFSGHMIDAPDRPEPRFPAAKEPLAAKAIADTLAGLGAGPADLALCGGACGGDILFAEACLKRGLRLEVRIPFEEPEFLKRSVLFAGDIWRDRFYQVKNDSNTKLYVMTEELGPLPAKTNPYERNNLWQLYSAQSWGPAKTHFLCLWNRKGGDGPGGTKHMYREVEKRSGQVHVLDTTTLW
ncbi:MAG: DUF4071 domain-containing protein [Desulfobacterales bacterium]|nr:MAG: DUF4071 domain-containing protein [Desulfobacterales bacterium]